MGVAVLLVARTLLMVTRAELFLVLVVLDAARTLSTVLCALLRFRWWWGCSQRSGVVNVAVACWENNLDGHVAAWQILLQCAGPRCHHFLRTVPPDQSARYAEQWKVSWGVFQALRDRRSLRMSSRHCQCDSVVWACGQQCGWHPQLSGLLGRTHSPCFPLACQS